MKKAISPIRRKSLFTLALCLATIFLGPATIFLGPATVAIAQDSPIVLDPAPTTGTPTLVVPESTHNWGKLLKGDKFEHKFTLRNDGDAPLLIENVKST